MSSKITALPATAGLALADLFAVVDDPAGTPATQKSTFQQLLDLLDDHLLPWAAGSGTVAANILFQGTIRFAEPIDDPISFLGTAAFQDLATFNAGLETGFGIAMINGDCTGDWFFMGDASFNQGFTSTGDNFINGSVQVNGAIAMVAGDISFSDTGQKITFANGGIIDAGSAGGFLKLSRDNNTQIIIDDGIITLKGNDTGSSGQIEFGNNVLNISNYDTETPVGGTPAVYMKIIFNGTTYAIGLLPV